MLKQAKILALATASVTGMLLVASAPASAADLSEPIAERTINGVVEFYAGRFWTNESEAYSSSSAQDALIFGGESRVDLPFNQNWSVQFDLGGDTKCCHDHLEDLTSSDENLASVYFGAHLTYREIDSYLVGFFGGFGVGFNDEEPQDGGVVGIEGQYYMDNITLYGQLGFMTAENDDEDTLEDAWFIRGVGRYFTSPDSKLEVEVAYLGGEADSYDADIVSWGVEYEYRFASWPGTDGGMSGFIAYKGNYVEHDDDDDNDHRIMAGFRLDLNTGSLLDRDRLGATVDLPDFHRWMAVTCGLSC